MPLHWEGFLQIATLALSFEAIYWWCRKFFFTSSEGRLSIASYLVMPTILPTIMLIWGFTTFYQIRERFDINTARDDGFLFMLIFGLVGGLVIRGVLAVLHKKANDKIANFAAVAIAVIMIAVSI